MGASILSLAISGIESYPVDVEVDLPGGLPGTTIVGLPQGAVREARDRVASAIRNSGETWRGEKLTINLAPADRRKDSSALDLPIAVGILAAQENLAPERTAGLAWVGELSLDGRLRPVAGVICMAVEAARLGLRGIVVPSANAAEARLVPELDVIAASTLREVLAFVRAGTRPRASEDGNSFEPIAEGGPTDLAHLRGQEGARRALEVAAAGGHNLLMVGPPGVGKTYLARSLPGILPPLERSEGLEVTRIHSVADKGVRGLIRRRPFRAPHHTVSDAGLVGGGTPLRPGEITLAHRGVLFLDELPEFRRSTLELMRQPLEDRRVEHARARDRVILPAGFTLIAAMNPCPCGYRGTGRCRCSPSRVRRYLDRLSGPLLDRFDLCIELSSLSSESLLELSDPSAPASESSQQVASRVREARSRALGRGASVSNAELAAGHLLRVADLDEGGRELMREALEVGVISARGHGRCLRVARTIADLAGEERVGSNHLAEALSYRLNRRILAQD